LFIRDPMETSLGRKIVDHGIKLVDSIGFEEFTFKKLATKINSTEASMYRYFESKQKFVGYLLSWYWLWLNYLVEIKTQNVSDDKKRFEILIETLTQSVQDDPATVHIDEAALHRIVVRESAKAYSLKQISQKERRGLHLAYEKFINSAAQISKGINSKYKFHKSLMVSIVEIVHQQLFAINYFPETTEIKAKKSDYSELIKFICDLSFKTLEA
ncbi:MAG: TetR/AcrR family transcriptional regulator, partial [Bdellovibrionales bacterium]|nr:TetR/AcrR family transcriptional regulator [Bdellovibrionales bacterium]